MAQHLASTYGDKAFKVAKMCNLTGKRWPVLGKRLHDEYTYIEGEVSTVVLGLTLWIYKTYVVMCAGQHSDCQHNMLLIFFTVENFRFCPCKVIRQV